MPLHGPGQRNWLPDKFHMPARKRAHTFSDKEEKKESLRNIHTAVQGKHRTREHRTGYPK